MASEQGRFGRLRRTPGQDWRSCCADAIHSSRNGPLLSPIGVWAERRRSASQVEHGAAVAPTELASAGKNP
jgi:hypothetical protein